MLSNPLALIAEITHRCPLHCVYCSNPIELASAKAELPANDWLRVFSEAARLGVLHVHLTGGEPLARTDLHDLIAGTKSHAHKIELAGWIKRHRIAFTANLVVHRQNLDHLEEMISFLEKLRPDRIEIAHTQYYGWALKNRAALMPTRAQVDNAVKIVASAAERLKGKIRIDSVVADYYARYPKPCMGGWGRQLMLIDPAGRALPCHAAGVIPELTFDNVREHSLEWIWQESCAFQKFRGESWMPEPCRSCDRRAEDFGGCRCQALLLTGDASATDPACSLAPSPLVIDLALLEVPIDTASAPPQGEWIYRANAK